MLILCRSCPRCNGDLVADSDQFGEYLECIQCGYIGETKDLAKVEKWLEEEDRYPVMSSQS